MSAVFARRPLLWLGFGAPWASRCNRNAGSADRCALRRREQFFEQIVKRYSHIDGLPSHLKRAPRVGERDHQRQRVDGRDDEAEATAAEESPRVLLRK